MSSCHVQLPSTGQHGFIDRLMGYILGCLSLYRSNSNSLYLLSTSYPVEECVRRSTGVVGGTVAELLVWYCREMPCTQGGLENDYGSWPPQEPTGSDGCGR